MSGVTFSATAFGKDPIVSTAYLDNLGRPIQSQGLYSLKDGDPLQTVVRAAIYDGWDLAAAGTKPVLYPAGQLPIELFGYRQNFGVLNSRSQIQDPA